VRLSFFVATLVLVLTVIGRAEESVLEGIPGIVQGRGEAEIDARFTAGAYASTESFIDALDGQTRNDFATVSSRFFLRASRLGESAEYEATLDLRDKHDFFDKLNRELLELGGANTFQLRQLSIRDPNEDGSFYFTLGRFPLWEAGAVHVDGAEAGLRFSDNLRSALFAGLNPARIDQSYLQFNRDAAVFGSYLAYVPKSEGWVRHFHGTAAFVGQTVENHLDRAYFFNNLVYQWGREGHLTSLVYLDFVPRIYVQTAYLSWRQGLTGISKGLSSDLSFSAIDVIQYSRRQNLLEVLAPSPYKEATWSVKQRIGSVADLQLSGSYGVRSADALSRKEGWFGLSFPQLFGGRVALQMSVGRRRDFVSTDSLARATLGYYSRDWEVTFDQEYGVKSEDSGFVTHPWLSELGVARHLSKSLYATVSLQSARDERVSIFSTFFRIGYRFGSRGVAPIRDAAPSRGKL